MVEPRLIATHWKITTMIFVEEGGEKTMGYPKRLSRIGKMILNYDILGYFGVDHFRTTLFSPMKHCA